MHRIIIASTLVLLMLPSPSQSHAADKITQETRGDQSPAVTVLPGGTSSISYNYIYNQVVAPAFSEIRQQYSECIRLVIDFQNKKLEELDKRLAEFYTQKTGAPDQDAKKWVEEVIRNAPEYKKQMQDSEKAREEWNREFSKDLLAKVYNLFIYIFATIDARFAAFQEANPKAAYEKSEKFVLFTDASQQDIQYVARTFHLPNGNRIQVYCSTGKMNRGLIIACPSLRFSEVVAKGAGQSFSVTPERGHQTITRGSRPVPLKQKAGLKDVEYPITGKEMLTGEFKTQFDATFQEFLKIAYAN